MHKVKEGLPGLLLAKLNRREESAEHPVEKLTFVSDQPDEQQLGLHGRHATTPLSLPPYRTCGDRRSWEVSSIHVHAYVEGEEAVHRVSWVIWMRNFYMDFCVETRRSLLLLHANRSAA